MAFVKTRFSILLFGVEKALKFTVKTQPAFRKRLKENNFIAQVKLQDDSQRRWYQFKDGMVSSQKAIHASPQVVIAMRSAKAAVKFLRPNRDMLETINAMKNFIITVHGPYELTS